MYRFPMRSLVFLAILGASALAAQPQSASAPSQPPAAAAPQPSPNPDRSQIRVQVNEVVVPVTVTDEKGRFVSDLEAKDFRIFDEGKEQKIEFFTRERGQPVVVGFLVEQSNRMRMYWKTYQDAIIDLISNLMPGDKKFSGYLITYSQDAELQVNTTHDPEKVIELAQRNLVTIYCVDTVGFGFSIEDEKNLVRLAEETGGRVEYPLQGNYSDVSGYLSTPSDEGNYALKVGTGGYAAAIASGIFKD